jgi:DNA-binding transcriptional regulator YiaG
MRALLPAEFAALLARAGVSQASFARLTGVTARQVNNGFLCSKVRKATWTG